MVQLAEATMSIKMHKHKRWGMFRGVKKSIKNSFAVNNTKDFQLRFPLM
jgi:hypothetical protein